MSTATAIANGKSSPKAKKARRLKNKDGYIMVRVSADNPMAMSNQYAFEHRLVASKMLGRALEPNEQVRHRNRIRDDNRPKNLVIIRVKTKIDPKDNPLVTCACGCGAKFYKFDSRGNVRRFVRGHHTKIGRFLRDGVTEAIEILRGIEWVESESGYAHCPSCGTSYGEKHQRSCALANYLKQYGEPNTIPTRKK